MSLYRRKDSPYWWVKLPAIAGESRPLSLSTGTAVKREAQEYHDRLKAERWKQDKLGQKPRHLWDDAVVAFLRETSDKRTHNRDKAMLAWLDAYLGGKYLDEINRALIDTIKFRRAELATKSTANRYLALIRSILRKALREWEWIDRMPATITLFPERNARVRHLTREQFDRLYKELPPHLADMALFAVSTGLRQGNLKGLLWAEVNLVDAYIAIPGEKHKNGRPHMIPINGAAGAVLQRQLGKHPKFVFTYRGEPITNVSTKAWWGALERAGIEDFRWHDLRHTFATWLRLQGVSTTDLQSLGGWESAVMAQRYAHITPTGLRKVASHLDNVLEDYVLATPKGKRD